MPNCILSEFACKRYFSQQIHRIFRDEQFDLNFQNLPDWPDWITNKKLVCKVDQEIKHRKLNDLVLVDVNINQCIDWINTLDHSYTRFIVEPFYQIEEEHYLMINFERGYDEIFYSKNGGIHFTDMESCNKSIINININNTDNTSDDLNITNDNLKLMINNLYKFFCKYHLTFMEVNPLAKLSDGTFIPIDFAAKYDTTSLYKWNPMDLNILDSLTATYSKNKTEASIEKLDEMSGASLKFKLINKNGSIWTLVAGGGASVLYTDAIINIGLLDKLANYGEYSGAPTTNHVYQYCSLIFKKMFKSKSDKLYLLVGGGISNFTDVELTFEGILKAIDDDYLNFRERVKIYVRRGGVNYKAGLLKFKTVCDKYLIDCTIFGPDVHITKFIKDIFPNNNNQIINTEHLKDVHLSIDNNNKSKIHNIINNSGNFNYSSDFGNKDSKIVILNYQTIVVQRILDYDYLIGKDEPSVIGIVYPQKANSNFSIFWGNKQILLPVFNSLDEAYKYDNKLNTVINYMSFRSAYDTSISALNHPNINTVVIVAEGIAERDARIISNEAKKLGKLVIGPSTVGCIFPGNLRLGNTCGSIENIKKLNLTKEGFVGIVTRSGGLLNEMCNIVSSYGLVGEAISIGGDRYPGSTFLDHILRYEKNDKIKLITMLGEVGGILELEVAEAVRHGLVKKPIIAWCMGTSAEFFDNSIQFGHAGSFANSECESATFKNNYMRQSGILVPDTFEEINNLFYSATLNFQNNYVNNTDQISTFDPINFDKVYKKGNIRKQSEFFSSISNETKDVLEYNSIPITDIVSKDFSLGRTIGHLLFKKNISEYFAEFIEKTLSLVADHGIAVSSAHNTAVCARAGQNISSSVASGLLCVHTKHGGAIQDAAKEFYRGHYIDNLAPIDFIQNMKNNNKYIPGIGHMYKNSTTRIDKRITMLFDFIITKFPNYDLVTYAKDVEELTLKKKENLILNVDGLIAVAIVSAFIYHYGHKETEEMLRLDSLNSIFIIGRTIGLCSTYADQKRLGQGLYRHPLSGISYL